MKSSRRRILISISAIALLGCDSRTDDKLFTDVFGFHIPSDWKVIKRASSDADLGRLYFHFRVIPSSIDKWNPNHHGFSKWQPMTEEQRFACENYVVDESTVSPGSTFSIGMKSSRLLLVYNRDKNLLIAMQANNAMGVRYPE